MPWIDKLRNLLCLIYQAWGGDCADLGTSPTGWINTLEGEYEEHGAPTFSNEPDRQAFLNTLDDTDETLNESGNSLSPQDNVRLRTLVADLRHDVGQQAAA